MHWVHGPEIMALWLHDVYLWIGFSPKASKLLIREQGWNSPERLRDFTSKNVDDIYNVIRNPDSKNANGMPNRGQQASVIAQENLKLAFFLFHHRQRCTFDWEVTGVSKDTLHLLGGQKRLEDGRDPNMLPQVKKADMAETMEAIKDCLRLCHNVFTVSKQLVIYVHETDFFTLSSIFLIFRSICLLFCCGIKFCLYEFLFMQKLLFLCFWNKNVRS